MRQWLVSQLSGSLAVTNLVQDRIYQASSLEQRPPEKPFLLYTAGLRVSTLGGITSRWPLQVWAHDTSGDYQRIDDLLEQVKKALTGLPPRPDWLMDVHWLEDSGDLRDDELRTITRYSRFQLVTFKGEEVI